MRKIENLFPTPVMFDALSRNFTSTELEYFKNLEIKNNVLNRISVNSYILNSPELSNLKKFIQDTLNFYFLEIHNPSSDVEIYITQSWMNVSNVGELHHSHNHPNSFISGTMYISADREVDTIHFAKTDSSLLKVIPDNYNIYNSPSWFYNVGSGDLLLFPSTLSHHVDAVQQSAKRKERISLSFNTFLKGNVGAKELLSELTI
jgi:uncharacterized protein (TIGR02466 family)